MNKIYTTLLLLSTLLVYGQEANLDAWMINTTGEKAQYNIGSGTVTLNEEADVQSVCYDDDYLYITCTGLSNYVMGPFPSNPNAPSNQSFVFKFDKNPTEETGTKTSTTGGPMGIAVNGVAFFNYWDGRSYKNSSGSNGNDGDGLWNADAWVSEGETMDNSGNGHPNAGGIYHYHANPKTLYSDPSTEHSPIIGFSLDGFPIYGPFGYTDPMDSNSAIKRIQSSYQIRSITMRNTLPDGSPSSPAGPPVNSSFPIGTYIEDYEYDSTFGDLDEHNGRFCITPEYPSGTYAYFLSTDNSGDPKFPYIIAGEYYGKVSASDLGPGAGNATVPGNATCSNDTTTTTTPIDTSDNNTVSIPASPGTITGKDSICPEDKGVTYSINAVTETTTYNWTVPKDVTIQSGANTTSITVDFGKVKLGDDQICVNAENSAGTSSNKCFDIYVKDCMPSTDPTSISDAFFSENVQIMNHKNELIVNTKKENIYLSVYSTLGERLHISKLSIGENTISLNQMANHIYILRLEDISTGKVYGSKFFK